MFQKEKSKEDLDIKIFVYGTLKVGGYFADAFNGRRINHIEATLKDAALYQVCNMYPGIVEKKGAVVHGELHTFCDAEKVLDHMDRIEGYREGQPHNLFDRQKVVVETEDGKEEEAYAYFFAHHDENCKRIESGVWEI